MACRTAAAHPVTAPGHDAARPSPPPIGELPISFTPRALVLDIDGTLIDQSLQLHPRTRSAIRAAAQWTPVVLATGRMFQSTVPFARELTVTAPLVCYQGALIREVPQDGMRGRVIFEEGLDAGVAVTAIEIMRAHGWHRQAYQDDELYCEEDRPEARLYADVANVPIHVVDDLATLVINGTTKLVCVSGDEATIDGFVETMRRELGDRARVTRSLPQFGEVVSPRVNKARAVETVLAGLGLTMAEAVAIGDAPNDIEMLAAVGCGVAVRGARDEVLAVAAAVCGPPAEGGVADVLEHFDLAG
jgi:Cof subfamily protein (haloacid dehalogenase superfamily)